MSGPRRIAVARAADGPLLGPADVFNGQYEIVRLIGRGGMGEVYEARHVFLGRRVALKILRYCRAENPAARKRLAKEARVLCEFDHPNIVRVFDAGVVDGVGAYIVMEFLEGDTLRGYLEERGRLPVEAALRFICDWADALRVAHDQGLIHRDIKPENLFITDEFVCKVLDFGAVFGGGGARITVQGSTIGTPAYMAPEHIKSSEQGDIDARADIYALGLVLYEMLVGCHPFVYPADLKMPSSALLMERHLHDAPRPLRAVAPDLPEALEPVVLKALAKDPASRWPSMRVFRAELRRVHKAVTAAAKQKAREAHEAELSAVRAGPRGTERMVPLLDAAAVARLVAEHAVRANAPGALESTSSETNPHVQLRPRAAVRREQAENGGQRKPREPGRTEPVVRADRALAARERGASEEPPPAEARPPLPHDRGAPRGNVALIGVAIVLAVVLGVLMTFVVLRRGLVPPPPTTAAPVAMSAPVAPPAAAAAPAPSAAEQDVVAPPTAASAQDAAVPTPTPTPTAAAPKAATAPAPRAVPRPPPPRPAARDPLEPPATREPIF